MRRCLALLVFLAAAASSSCAWPSPSERSAASASGAAATTPSSAADVYASARQRMVSEQLMRRDIMDEKVLQAMRKVPRHLFVPAEYVSQAHEDHPVLIGYGQTISQPYIVALMTQHLDVKPGDKVLEIGTGSGYQAAILAELTDEVYTVEIIEPLAEAARARLAELGYHGVKTKVGDGYFGWEEHAPFDAIVVTAAPDHIPQPLVRQLSDGGRLLIPVGPPGDLQTLWKLEKRGGTIVNTNLGGVIFVPLTGDH